MLGSKKPWYWYAGFLQSLIGRGESVGKARRDNSATKGLQISSILKPKTVNMKM